MGKWLCLVLLLAGCKNSASAADTESLMEDPDVVAEDAATDDPDAVDVAPAEDASPSDAGPDDASPDDVAAQPDTGPAKKLRILFLGNSYTYVNDLPAMTQQFAQAAGVKLEQVSVTQGGATLQVLIDQTAAVATIAQGGWSHVVLQDQSVEPAGDPASFLSAAAHVLAVDATQVGAEVAFYQTWPRKPGDALYQQAWTGGTPEKLGKKLHDAYEKAAQQNGGVRVPVGDAWLLMLAKHPEVNLYQADGSHPVAAGTYLGACVFAVTLAHVDPLQVKWLPDGVDATTGQVLRQACRDVTAQP